LPTTLNIEPAHAMHPSKAETGTAKTMSSVICHKQASHDSAQDISIPQLEQDGVTSTFDPAPDLSDPAGLWSLPAFFAAPDDEGVLFSTALALPAFTRACYFAPFQKHAINPALDLWPEAYNQCHPLAVRSIAELNRKGFFLLLQTAEGDYLALLPLTGPRSMSWFHPRKGELYLECGHYGTEAWAGDLPLLSWARGTTPYEACRQAWQAAADHPALSTMLTMRGRKTFPSMFEYLGWCSWEECKWDISEKGLMEILDALQSSDIPVRWTLFDDGYIDEGPDAQDSGPAGQEGEVPAHQSERKLDRFTPRPDKFPRGWSPLLARKAADKIRWMGVWLNFNGYWGGIRADNHLGAINAHLQEIERGLKMPRPAEEAARGFYDAFVGEPARAGFDFLKVDNQAGNIAFYQNIVPNAVEATLHNHRALQDAARRHELPVINCMAHNPLGVFGAGASEVTRCSEDYKKGDLWRAKHHLSNSFANMLWLGQTSWGDHDMFHSSDAAAGDVMARSKAISGGPIYLSDHPRNFDKERIAPLCFRDGRLLRPLAPAVPLPDSIFADTYDEAAPLRVIAPLPHACAAVAIYNLTDPEQPVRAHLAAEDYLHAGAMLQYAPSEWTMPEEGLVAYDVKTGQATRLEPGRSLELLLPNFGDQFFVLCPIVNGVAVIGRPDKYLPPCGISSIERHADEIICTQYEPSQILFWCESPEGLSTKDVLVRQIAPQLWSCGGHHERLTIRRGT
jgi:hypothetical protein